MQSLLLKRRNPGETPDRVLSVVSSVVVSVFTLSTVANTALYSVKTVEGTSHVLSLWIGKTCIAEGCFTKKLPPDTWCGERRATYTAMQAISIASLFGSLLLVLCSFLRAVKGETLLLNICHYGSAAVTWLLLIAEWVLMAAIFHSKICADPSFDDINFQYGPSFALVLMAWLILTIVLMYYGEKHMPVKEPECAMTEEVVIRQCKKHNGYSTPELNEKLYLHYMGFRRISCLGAFHQCTVLYLNNNAISNLEGLRPLQQLRSLYLSQNALQDCLSLPNLQELRLLDISCNSIELLEGLGNVPGLETLLASRNRVRDIKPLEALGNLMTLDVSLNLIASADDALSALSHWPTLRTCVLYGNPFLKALPSYRKLLIPRISSLCWLDQQPVTPEERRCAEARASGGRDAEEAQRRENHRLEEAERLKQFLFFTEARRQLQAVPAQRAGDAAAADDDVYIPRR